MQKADFIITVIEDFFRLGGDGLQYYSTQFIASSVMPTILHAACSALTVLKLEPLRATLQFLRDFVEYASDNPPYSHTNDHPAKTLDRSPTIQGVKSLVQGQGEILTQRVLTGMMYTFPEDCIPDASGVLLAMFQILPRETASWVSTTVNMLPAGSISQQEQERILRNIDQYVFVIYLVILWDTDYFVQAYTIWRNTEDTDDLTRLYRVV